MNSERQYIKHGKLLVGVVSKTTHFLLKTK